MDHTLALAGGTILCRQWSESGFDTSPCSDVVGTVTRQEYYAENRMEEVVARSNAYVEAGADCVFPIWARTLPRLLNAVASVESSSTSP